VDTFEAALDAIETIRGRGQHRIVVKEAIGLAGHNSIRLWEPGLLEAQRRWLERAVRSGRQIVIEPWLDRVLDFSIQLEMTPGRLELCGYTGLINDAKGQFQGNWAAPNYARRLPQAVTALFRQPSDISERLHVLYEDIFDLIEVELRRADYLGPIGVDAFIYRPPGGGFRLKPIVEINPRYTMGRLTVELMKRTCPGSHGLFRLMNQSQLSAKGFADFPAYAASLAQSCPLRLEGEPSPRIHQGALCLNDPARAQACLAVFQVSRQAEKPAARGAGAA
jgi:hypothetical protein